MDTIFDKLDYFFMENNLHVFLLKGVWGTGKTFTVNEWCRRMNIEPYIISLFGITCANELYERFLDEVYIRNKIIDKCDEVEINAEFHGVKLGVKGLLNLLKKRKYIDNKERVIIFDDIERKDNHISIETIFGLIDNLKIEKTKIILISNSEEFEEVDKVKFNGFKEKIVDMEYTILNVSKEVIKTVLSNDELYNLLNLSYTKNLRSLIKLNRILFSENIEVKKENKALIQAILFAIESIDNGKFSRDSLIEERIESFQLFQISNNKMQIESQIQKEREEVLSFREEKVFSESVKDKFTNIKNESLIKNLEQIYTIIKYGDYNKLNTIQFDYSNSLEQSFNINYGNLRFNYNRKALKGIIDSVNNALIDEYDKMSIFVNYISFYCRYYKSLETYKLVSFSNEIKNKVIKEAINELLNYNYEWSNYFNQLFFEEKEMFEKGKYDYIKLELGKKFQKAMLEKYDNNININDIRVIVEKLNLLYRHLNISESFTKNEKYIKFHKKIIKCFFSTLNISAQYADEKILYGYVNYLKVENIVYDDIKEYVKTNAFKQSKGKKMINKAFNNIS